MRGWYIDCHIESYFAALLFVFQRFIERLTCNKLSGRSFRYVNFGNWITCLWKILFFVRISYHLSWETLIEGFGWCGFCLIQIFFGKKYIFRFNLCFSQLKYHWERSVHLKNTSAIFHFLKHPESRSHYKPIECHHQVEFCGQNM